MRNGWMGLVVAAALGGGAAGGWGQASGPAAETQAGTQPATQMQASTVASTQPATVEMLRAAIEKKMAKAMELLEAGKREELIRYLAPPAEVAKQVEAGQFAEVVEKFKGAKAQALLAALKSVQGQAPEFNEDRTEAVYTPAGQAEKKLRFRVFKGEWYLN